MRARLLDMGEVGAVRSQSLARAVAAVLDSASAPVVLLVKPSEPVVAVGGSHPASAAVDLEFCRAERVPVVRMPIADEVWFQGPSHLLLYLVAPAHHASDLGLGIETGPWPEAAVDPLLEVCEQLGIDASVGGQGRLEARGRSLARCSAYPLPNATAVCWDLFVGSDSRELEIEARTLLRPAGVSASGLANSLAASRTSFAAEAGESIGFPEVAEALIVAVESRLGLELVPSMPTPDEMDAIYEWDERMLASELLEGPGDGGAGATTYLM